MISYSEFQKKYYELLEGEKELHPFFLNINRIDFLDFIKDELKVRYRRTERWTDTFDIAEAVLMVEGVGRVSVLLDDNIQWRSETLHQFYEEIEEFEKRGEEVLDSLIKKIK